MSDNIIKLIDVKDYDQTWKVVKRHAIRGIIKNKDGKLAMIQSQKYGELKFPGGGMEPNETEQETLLREVAEETGLHVLAESISYYGQVIERKKAFIEKDSIFEMQSKYYYCCVDEVHIGLQNLDEYEEKLGYQLVWISCEDAIQQMEKVKSMLSDQLEKMPWVYRDYIVLNSLMN